MTPEREAEIRKALVGNFSLEAEWCKDLLVALDEARQRIKSMEDYAQDHPCRGVHCECGDGGDPYKALDEARRQRDAAKTLQWKAEAERDARIDLGTWQASIHEREILRDRVARLEAFIRDVADHAMSDHHLRNKAKELLSGDPGTGEDGK